MKVLIIGPAFFDYTKAIAVEINSREVYAFVFNELHSETILSKIAYRLKLDFLFSLKVKKYRSKIYQYIDEHKITDVLFVSPDIIDKEYLVEVKQRARIHLYMWDGFCNKKNSLSVLNLFDTKASFDKFDCQEYGLHYIPLFAEKMYQSNDAEKKYDLSFCGTVHSNRLMWMKKVQRFAKDNNLRVGLFLYYYSSVLLFIRLLMNRCCFDLFNKVSYSGYKKEEIADLFKLSKAVLDITHPNQKGLTSRTFEALRSGSKLITNNENCEMLGREYISRIFIVKNIENQQEALLEFIELKIPPLNAKQDHFLSIERFVDQILENWND
ncbi:hypothetical protein BCLUESOX_2168 [bacterium endosymbiont of Bathymodiolus sp. 5 South]|jgi:hypothetical protein|nr:hypothetical protein [uncultured Gammaproteobacteria bacterium]SHN91857.1 hypothetical protein BCLUESOX_2168 [bacterium endosymbiont of Bathymodiolus sp. 5 South]VVH59023.1 hypothetical protein BSPCLSOX_119 [uncultured Gammaproteobacteria bacterium]VVH63170.1 hypothetical protein BSPWISOX_1319 [uncultured Gammaproteobacteria bacterium]VVM23131.1 hypothetical protein BSPWISOXPB_5390 [uncultured Gammaproteobacteria bacterium]